jgi:hypothetical protein
LNHRQRADHRLARHVPQLRDGEARALYLRLVDRTVESEAESHSVLGSSLSVRDPATQSVRKAKVAQTEPNAPLLMRLVRHPYAQETARFGRVEYREVFAREGIQPTEPALAYLEELRAAYQFVSPMRSNPHRPEDRPLPFMNVRNAAVQEGEPHE